MKRYRQKINKLGTIEKYKDAYARHRFNILANLIPAAMNCEDKQYALDVGCGLGGFSNLLTKRGYNTIGIDINSAVLDIAKKSAGNATFMKMDALHLGFDIIILLEKL